MSKKLAKIETDQAWSLQVEVRDIQELEDKKEPREGSEKDPDDWFGERCRKIEYQRR